jgi:Na+-translocating ferredoxin:NAD+ oxidoreductase RnfG subunit
MKTLKIASAIFSLIAVGFVAGFYTNRFLVLQNIKQVANMRYAQGFEESLFEKVNATPQQQTQITPTVEKYADKIATVYQESRTKRRALMDSLHTDLSPYLNRAQLEELDHFCFRYYYSNNTKQTASNEVK